MLPRLQEIAKRQHGVFTRGQALSAGCTDEEIRGLLRRGEWRRIRHGAYTAELPEGAGQEHLRRCWAVVLASGPAVAIGGPSAAVALGLALVEVPRAVHVVAEHARTAAGIVVVRRTRPESAARDVAGLPVSPVARAVVDSTTVMPFGPAVVLADSALRSGAATREELRAAAESARWHATSRRVVAFADPRSESVGESLARVAIDAAGLPVPELQVELRGASGRSYRVDFLWRQFRMIGEFDGRVKYGADGRALWEEKRREDDLRAVGYGFVRFGTADARDPSRLGRIVRSAFGLAG